MLLGSSHPSLALCMDARRLKLVCDVGSQMLNGGDDDDCYEGYDDYDCYVMMML